MPFKIQNDLKYKSYGIKSKHIIACTLTRYKKHLNKVNKLSLFNKMFAMYH